MKGSTSVTCIICQESVQGPKSVIGDGNVNENLELDKIYESFLHFFLNVPISSVYTWDFYKKGFPFCVGCTQLIVNLDSLHEKLALIQCDISKIFAKVSSIVVKTVCSKSQKSLLSVETESKRDNNEEEYDNEYKLIDKQISDFRSSLYNRLSPQVVLNDFQKLPTSTVNVSEIILPSQKLPSPSPIATTTSATNQQNFILVSVEDAVNKGEEVNVAQVPFKIHPTTTNPHNDLLNFTIDDDLTSYSSTYPQTLKLEYYNDQQHQQEGSDLQTQQQQQQVQHVILIQDNSIPSTNKIAEDTHQSEISDDYNSYHNEGDSESAEVSDSVMKNTRRRGTKRKANTSSSNKNNDQKPSRIPRRKRNTKRIDLGNGKFQYGKWPYESIETGFKCSTCEIRKDTKDKVLRHIMEYHMDENRLSCQVPNCEKTVGNIQAFLRHQIVHSSLNTDPKPEILQCGKKKWLFDEAWIYEENDKGFNCLECGQHTNNLDNILEHLRKFHKEPSVRLCMTCGKEFKNNIALASHAIVHTDKRRKPNPVIKSGLDGKFIYRGWTFTQEAVNENGDKYKCCECGEIKSSQRYITQHIRRRHLGLGRRKETFLCKLCGRAMSSSQALKKHETDHDKLRRKTTWKCEDGKTFLYDGKWSFEKIQDGFKCGSCGCEVKYRHSMYQHLQQVHLNPGGFACSVCGKTFAQKPHLQRHESMHTGVRAFICELCGNTYRTKDHLTQHKQTHLALKCHKCFKTFKFRKGLHQHLKNQHPDSTNTVPSPDSNVHTFTTTTSTSTTAINAVPEIQIQIEIQPMEPVENMNNCLNIFTQE